MKRGGVGCCFQSKLDDPRQVRPDEGVLVPLNTLMLTFDLRFSLLALEKKHTHTHIPQTYFGKRGRDLEAW